MKTQKFSIQLYALFITVLILMSLTPVFGDSGAVWTTDENGGSQDGNQYSDPEDVWLNVRLSEGVYHIRVTDSSGKNVLSSPPEANFTVNNLGEITRVEGRENKTLDDGSIIIKLWPFDSTDGQYKVWVSTDANFKRSASKTDNFDVLLVPKYFKLYVTNTSGGGVYDPLEPRAFFVDYAIDEDGNKSTVNDQIWTLGEELLLEGEESEYYVFTHEAWFSIGDHILWKFYEESAGLVWESRDVYGPELIEQAGQVNNETLFLIKGQRLNSTGGAMDGEAINLSIWDVNTENYVLIGEATTAEDGSFKFIALSCLGWDESSELYYEFEADGKDKTVNLVDFPVNPITLKAQGNTVEEDIIIVFTPSGEDEFGNTTYKVSSTNMGSSFLSLVYFRDPDSLDPDSAHLDIYLPEDQANAPYDSPNFIPQHTEKGGIDIHVKKGSGDTMTTDITKKFTINELEGGKHIEVLGKMPQGADSITVILHLDYQISSTILTFEETESFKEFEYTFVMEWEVLSNRGVRSTRGVR